MRHHRSIRGTLIAGLAASLVLAGTIPAIAVDGSASDYPTWSEVRAAQDSEAAAEAEYARLQRALQQSSDEATAATSAAASAHGRAREAREAVDAAVAREAALQSRIEQAEQSFGDNDEAVGRMVSWMYTNGTGLASASALATASDPEEFMAKFSMSSQVSGTWNGIAERAKTEVNSAASLHDQAADAKRERERLADEAEAAAASADRAQQDSDAAVARAGERSETMYAQLAALRGTTAAAERQYQIGLQVAEQAAEQERQREEAARQQEERDRTANPPAEPPAGGSESPGGTDPGTGGGDPAGGVGVDPAGAQAHARSSLGAYGWGDDQFSCLVPLWNGESGWRADALNPYSGAYGIPQSLPAEKMATAGPDWRTNGNTQVDWGLAYIQAAYGSPCAAWGAWQARDPHWY
ncbi:coiled-coil domain-containing protein [Leucobacter manosquensis]|uniref:Lytic transglycosylase domain-containing protein n=1 Tax=Leucobacter manosquensis TaxID=2810611 RepID=A0ABS5M8T9_9MICO|nr:hypothetical protein [Leucobacter manosquensis]MBS3183401.1 hypothetical protein [Leucobacter manosquensis]